jgi:hypothetical protein
MLLRDLICSSRFSCVQTPRESEKRADSLQCEMRETMDDMIEVGSLYPEMTVDRSRRFQLMC